MPQHEFLLCRINRYWIEINISLPPLVTTHPHVFNFITTLTFTSNDRSTLHKKRQLNFQFKIMPISIYHKIQAIMEIMTTFSRLVVSTLGKEDKKNSTKYNWKSMFIGKKYKTGVNIATNMELLIYIIFFLLLASLFFIRPFLVLSTRISALLKIFFSYKKTNKQNIFQTL